MVKVRVPVTGDTLLEKTRWLRLNAEGKHSVARLERDAEEKQSYLVVEFTDNDTAILFKLSN